MVILYYDQYTINNMTYYLAVDGQLNLSFVGSPNHGLSEIHQYIPDAHLMEDKMRTMDAARYLQAYFNGEELPISQHITFHSGTDLQRAVWQTLLTIKRGQTWSYSQLAQKVGYPNAVRAVATAVAKNPVLFVVPCHRVIRKNGDIGQYRAGKDLKRQLLMMEKAIV